MPRPSRETVMDALLAVLTAALETAFTANTTNGSAVLASPSTTAGLFVGLPVFGAGIPRGATILTLSPLTLTQNATATGTAVALTTGFLTFGRRLVMWTQCAEQPALFLRDIDEELEYIGITLQRQTIKAEIWIYSN